MEGHRRYAEEPQPNWYAGQQSPAAPETNPYDSAVHARPSGAFRLPDQRSADPYAAPPAGYAAPDPVADSGSIRIPVRGPEYPPGWPGGDDAPAGTATTMYGSGSNGSGARDAPPYRTRRPFSSVVFAIVTIVLMIPAVLLLVQTTFVDDLNARGIVPAVLLTLGLPLTGSGLCALAGGGQPNVRDAWLRQPLAYLPVGLVLLVAAGLGVA